MDSAETNSVPGTPPPDAQLALERILVAESPIAGNAEPTEKPKDPTDAPLVPLQLQHSASAAQYLGKRVPKNTSRVNISYLRALARFLITASDFFQTEPHLRSYYLGNAERTANFEVEKMKELLFQGCQSGGPVSEEVQKKIRHHLIEFVVGYRSKVNEEVSPSTMKSYILGIQRAFLDWGFDLQLLKGPIFADKDCGLMSVLDNKIAEQQSMEMTVKSHNTLPKDDIIKLLRSKSCDAASPSRYLNRLVLIVGVSLGIRPTAMVELTVDQFQRCTRKGESVIEFTEKIGSINGRSKTNRGGWRAVKTKRAKITIWNIPVFDGSVNVFEDISSYLEIRKQLGNFSDRFFVQINPKKLDKRDCFKRQHIGKNSFSKIIKSMCAAEGITGNGVHDFVNTHSLRGTMASLLLEAGHSDSTVAMRTGHRDIESLKSYQNLQGEIGMKQLEDLFGDGGNNASKYLNIQIGVKEDDGSQIPNKKQKKDDGGVGISNISASTVTMTVNNYFR